VISIDLHSATPRYLQLADALRALVGSGELAAGDRLPSTHELVQQTGLAPATIAKAVGVLRLEGLVVTVPGVGVVVR
jgi:DNA-binding GntR family transcriptional regulator